MIAKENKPQVTPETLHELLNFLKNDSEAVVELQEDICHRYIEAHIDNRRYEDEIQSLQNTVRDLLVALDQDEAYIIANEYDHSRWDYAYKKGSIMTQILQKRVKETTQRLKKSSND